MPPRQIRLHAFEMACIGHIQQGLWRHPRDQATSYKTLSHWVALAQTLERGLFDGLFLADVLGIYDVYGAAPDAALQAAVQVPNLDPMLLIPAMAHATKNLGFAMTANTAATHPFIFARQMSTLDHLSGGRIGWNVVTGYLDSAARALGHATQPEHDTRYDAADAVMEALRQLWQESWADDAVLADRATGHYANPACIHPVSAQGKAWRTRAIHLCEPSPQRGPVIYQAGASARGLQFAGTHAECVFINGTTPAQAAKLVAGLRAAAAPRPIQVFAGLTIVTGRTPDEAADKCADYERYADTEAALVQSAGSMGIDFAALAEDDPLPTAPTQAITSNLAALAAGPPLTKRAFRERLRLGGRQPPIVGSPTQIAEILQDWMTQADLDGFVLARTVTPECFVDFVDLVVPELQRRGVYKTAYSPGTLRQKFAT